MYVFIQCTKSKADHRCNASEMYTGSLFRMALKYALTLTERKNIFVLSAKHHLLRLSDEIVPYKRTLKDMSAEECEEWGEIVKKQMKEKGINFNEKAVFLAGEKYNKYFEGMFHEEEFPWHNKRIGKILAWLYRKVGGVNESLIPLNEYLDAYLDDFE